VIAFRNLNGPIEMNPELKHLAEQMFLEQRKERSFPQKINGFFVRFFKRLPLNMPRIPMAVSFSLPHGPIGAVRIYFQV